MPASLPSLHSIPLANRLRARHVLGVPISVAAQVELLLTLEEFCSEEGVFESAAAAGSDNSSGGASFAPLFANLLQLLYDGEIVEEGAITNWAAEKEHADDSEKVFLQKVQSPSLCAVDSCLSVWWVRACMSVSTANKHR